MNRAQVESRVHRTIDDVIAGRPVEDDTIELKSEWPSDFRRAARRIAGHANAAGQQPILWVIGIDEGNRQVIGAQGVDPAAWYSQLRAHFAENWAPAPKVFNIPRDDKIVVAILFETEAAPFLVRADPDLLELPWRSATMIRSARRHEILSMFGDVVHHPELDLIDVALTAQANRVVPPDKIIAHTFSLNMQLYVTPRTERPVHLPLYRSLLSFQPDGSPDALELGPARAKSAEKAGIETDLADKQVAVTAPKFIIFYASMQLPVLSVPETGGVARCVLAVAGSSRALVAEARIEPAPTRSTPDFRWWLRP